jgi:hypothetical protein
VKKTLAIAVLAGLALLAGSTASAANHARGGLLGPVPHHATAAGAGLRNWLAPLSGTASATTGGATTPTCGESCASYQSSIDQYFTDVAAASGSASNVYSVATQYSDNTGSIAYQQTFGGSIVDTNPYPANGCNDAYNGTGDTVCLSDLQLENEIQSVIASQGWPTGTSNLYFIFTPSDVGICFNSGSASNGNQCSTNAFCAYHSDFLDGGSRVVYGVEPDDETIPTGGCDFNVQDPNNVNVDPTFNTISHEQNEAITDPLGNNLAWLASDGFEIGDLCAWTFGAAAGGDVNLGTAYNQVINGDHYWLQEEYSNADGTSGSRCVQQLHGTAGPPAINGDGSGPLLYNGGPVMRTNTTYAIYWMPTSSGPTSPTNSQPPIVSGVAAVGKTLTTTHGTWTGSPTSYAYQWQQCSATGTACVDVPGATGTSYKVAAGDAGHELRSEVSATNSSGTSSLVPSTATEVVVPLPAVVVAPAVSGTAAVGKTLSTTQGTWNTPASYTYQWLRCSASGGSCSAIGGDPTSTYKVKSSDAGHEIESRVSATNAAGTTAAVSAPTAAVLDVPHASAKPRITGTARVGKVLSTDGGHWTNSPTSFSYQWLRCSAKGTACAAIPGATKPTYKLGKRDAHHKLRVRVTARNSAGSGSATSSTTHLAAASRH